MKHIAILSVLYGSVKESKPGDFEERWSLSYALVEDRQMWPHPLLKILALHPKLPQPVQVQAQSDVCNTERD